MANPRLLISNSLAELYDCDEHDLRTIHDIINVLEQISTYYFEYLQRGLIGALEVAEINKIFAKLYEMAPTNSRLVLVKAKLFVAIGDSSTAMQMLGSLLKESPLFWEGHFYLSQLMYGLALREPRFSANMPIFASAAIRSLDTIISYDRSALSVDKPAASLVSVAINLKKLILSSMPVIQEKIEAPKPSRPPLSTSGFLRMCMPPDVEPEMEEQEEAQAKREPLWIKVSSSSVLSKADSIIEANYTKEHSMSPIGSERNSPGLSKSRN